MEKIVDAEMIRMKLENMSKDIEKITQCIKEDSKMKLKFLSGLIEPKNDEDKEFLEDIFQRLLLRIQFGCEQLATDAIKDRVKKGLPIWE